MNQVLEDRLKALDDVAIAAITALFTVRIEVERPLIGENDSNLLLGEKYRSYEQAKELLRKVLIDLEAYKDKKVGLENYNKGK